MTRRIAMAILLIVWLILIAAGISTYAITQSLVIRDLDDTILGRIASLPELERPGSLSPQEPSDARDRFAIQYDDGRVEGAEAATASANIPPPEIVSRGYAKLDDGTLLRTLTVRALAKPKTGATALTPVTVIYSASAQRVDLLLRQLAYSLAGFGALAAVGTTLVAWSVARAALKPMRDSVEVIGKIDENSLNRRIAVYRLPPELAPLGHRLNELLSRLQTAFTQRKQFLADASHELRTPVAALVTTLEVALRKRRNESEYVGILERCLSDAQLLNQLVLALLEQARSERFITSADCSPVDIGNFLRQCVETARTLAAVKGIKVTSSLADAVLITDELKLRSIVMNLLTNAVEYTRSGGSIALTMKLTPDPQAVVPAGAAPESVPAEGRKLTIRVQDDGPGIAPRHLPHVFEPFYRADTARAGTRHHLGMGLALVRVQSRALGGDCTAESPVVLDDPPHGTAFTLEIPTLEISADHSTTSIPITQPIEKLGVT